MRNERFNIEVSDDCVCFYGDEMSVEEVFDFINYFEKKGFNKVVDGIENSILCLMKKKIEVPESVKKHYENRLFKEKRNPLTFAEPPPPHQTEKTIYRKYDDEGIRMEERKPSIPRAFLYCSANDYGITKGAYEELLNLPRYFDKFISLNHQLSDCEISKAQYEDRVKELVLQKRSETAS